MSSPIATVLQDYEAFARRLRIKFQFIDTNDTPSVSGNEMQLLLRTANPNFKPRNSSKVIETYISNCRIKLVRQLSEQAANSKTYYDRQSLFESVIYSLTKIDTIVITQADKNMGPVIVDREWYEAEALRQLLDTTTYTRLPYSPQVSVLKNSLLDILKKYNKQSTKFASFLLQPFSIYADDDAIPCAYFYMLIKLHKPEPTPIAGRPIVASIRSLTYNVSKFLDKILQPLMKKFNSYLKNSFDIIEILEMQSFPQDTVILTGDVQSLYPSIDITDGLDSIRRALELFTPLDGTYIGYISELLEWVLTNNYIVFGDTYWLQIKGTAMGTPVAVTFANIYLSMLEYDLAHTPETEPFTFSAIVSYKRYIDDIFALFTSQEQAQLYCKLFNSLRPHNIKVDFLISTSSGDILDITLLKGIRFAETGHFDTTLFQKACNKYLYIPPFSFHPRSTFRAFINSELQRFRLHCTNDLDFSIIQNKFYNQLVDRGYSTPFLDSIFPYKGTRQEIFIKRKDNKDNKRDGALNKATPLVFVTDFTPTQRTLDFNSAFELNDSLALDPIAFMIFANRRPITAFKSSANLKERLTNSRYPFSVQNKIN